VASGDITFNSDIKLNDIECSQSSGDFHVNNSITGSNIYIKSISGDITAEKLNSKHYDIHATSGDLDINSISGSGNVKTISGDVKINYSGINEYSNMSSTSGDINLIVPENMSFEFDGNCTSGNVNANFPLNYQNERKSRASAKVGSGPYKKINANAVSGDIKISK
jgi:lia operon protein LiaG